ncbi:MAG: hypothetical protein LBQ66_01695 [Planctomycetaceae bacterium]|nr:hypothetical protein [Planctomycetaceae bacterium]
MPADSASCAAISPHMVLMVMPGILLGRLLLAGSMAVPTSTATFVFGNAATPARCNTGFTFGILSIGTLPRIMW